MAVVKLEMCRLHQRRPLQIHKPISLRPLLIVIKYLITDGAIHGMSPSMELELLFPLINPGLFHNACLANCRAALVSN
jgi:hypothetical protein